MATAKAKAPACDAVYSAIAAVMEDLSDLGIGEDGKNADEGWKYRSIGAVYKSLSKLLVKHGLVVLPRVLDRSMESVGTSGGVWYRTVLKVEYTLVATADGSSVTVLIAGEAMDPGDKGANKAMSAAYKYMAFQVFCIPIGAEDDADLVTPPKTAAPKGAEAAAATKPAATGKAATTNSAAGGRRVGAGNLDLNEIAEIQNRIAKAPDDVEALAIARELVGTDKNPGKFSRIAKLEHRKELARDVLGKRAELVPVDVIDSLDKMAAAFEKQGLITSAESLAMRNAARSRLNLDLLV